MGFLLAAATLAMGAVVVWWLYGDGWRRFEGDAEARKVTGVAMFGSFVPFIFFAAMAAQWD